MKNALFWDVTPCGCCKNRRLQERIASIIRKLCASVDNYSRRCSQLADFCPPHDGGDTILRNVDSYKSHMA
jgi:hypothetical protein